MEMLDLLRESRIAGAVRLDSSEIDRMITHLRFCLRRNGFEFMDRPDTKNEDFLERTGMNRMSAEEFSRFLQMGCSAKTYRATVENTLPNRESKYIHYFHLYKNIGGGVPEDNKVVIISFHKLDDEIYPDYGDGSFEVMFAEKWIELYNKKDSKDSANSTNSVNPIVSYKVLGSEFAKYRIVFTFKKEFSMRTLPINIKNAMNSSFPKGMHYRASESSIIYGDNANEAIVLLPAKPKTAAKK